MKVTTKKLAPPPPKFTPFEIHITVDNVEEARALRLIGSSVLRSDYARYFSDRYPAKVNNISDAQIRSVLSSFDSLNQMDNETGYR